MSRFAGAVNIAATDGPAGLRGLTVTAACSVSDNPATLLICLNWDNPNNRVFVENGVFSLSVLNADQIALARAFSGEGSLSLEERFSMATWKTLKTGAPILEQGTAGFDCEIECAQKVQTHMVIFGRVIGLQIGDNKKPLIYHDRDYRNL
jgi:cob(II)yrinic acid a,c-diamide reductase